MPRKSSSTSYGRASAQARIRRQQRAEENEENRQSRLLANRTRNATTRGIETVAHRHHRLTAESSRMATLRENETIPETQERLASKRTQMATILNNETVTETQERLVAQSSRTATLRENETATETQQRLVAQSSRTATLRENETAMETQQRLVAQNSRRATLRENETATETQQRLVAQSSQRATLRENETVTETQQRLVAQSSRTATARLQETQERQQVRIMSDQIYHDMNRANLRDSRHLNWRLEAFYYDSQKDYNCDPNVIIGGMEKICAHCGAKKWPAERPGLCCLGGKINLPLIQNPPAILKNLLTHNTSPAKRFRRKLREYNSAFQMTSFGAAKHVTEFGFLPTYKIQGQCYHLMGALLPLPEASHTFVQVYFMGGNQTEAQRRCTIVQCDLELDIVMELQDLFHRHHKYVGVFKYALEHMQRMQNQKIIIRADKRPTGEHERRYNAPVADEIAILMVDEEHEHRDIILHLRSGQLQRIAETHRAYDSLQYPLIFWNGQDGYHFQLWQRNPETGLDTGRSVTAKCFYSYHFMVREQCNHILYLKGVTSQFMVDMYAKIESERLGFIRRNQKKLRVEEYIHLRDAINSDGDHANIGQPIILPSSYTGGPRYMYQRTQDAMAYVRKFGRSDLFITFTCNPKWTEINNALFPHQIAKDRHDLIARVFHEKQKKLLWLIREGRIFGDVNACMTTIEWQKRGLPHSHTLVWCKVNIRGDDVDKIISAEFPDEHDDPELFQIVKSQLIHGPCGVINRASPCMQDHKCSQKYPKAFIEETQTDNDGYPLYRRRAPENGGNSTTLRVRGEVITVDNRWVVPYNSLLCKILKAHINVEYCSSIKAIKYITKYINKGSDMATFAIGDETARDEIKVYQTGRYISSNEAIWRIFGFEIHQRFPTVVNLAVHLENGQRVYFNEATVHNLVETPPETTLTAFFKLCQQDDFARTLLYTEIPTYFTWSQQKKWVRRKQGQTVPGHEIKASDAIGRAYTVHPNHRECFYLRLLLHTVRGPTSFEDLRRFQEALSPTYQEACGLRGLLKDDEQWKKTLEEAAVSRIASQMRQLFAIMLTACEIDQPTILWDTFRNDMSEDFLHRARLEHDNMSIAFSPAIYNLSLTDLSYRVHALNRTLTTCGMPEPYGMIEVNYRIHQESSYDYEACDEFIRNNEPRLVDEQRNIYHSILESITNDKGVTFFIDAPGGTGKTFLLNLLLAKVRHSNNIALAVASSGIAATLLDGGRTAHSMFSLPLDLERLENPLCNIKKNSDKAKLLQICKLIIWDEATMSHKRAMEALDSTLQDLKNSTKIMGGVTLVFAGDFRQTLPIIPRGMRADEINACLKKSYLWHYIKKMSLTLNMRVHLHADNAVAEFASQLLRVGNGLMERDSNNQIQLPFQTVKTEEELIARVFPDIRNSHTDYNWLCGRGLLAPRNDCVKEMNIRILNMLPGPSKTYNSVDTICSEEETVNYPIEFLNSLEPTGTPPHILLLKLGAPIMLLRNLDPPKLCNGTRLIIKSMMNNVLEATIISGKYAGVNCFIPRIPMRPTDLPFEFERLQFPVRLSFAMTINKSQGQSLEIVGLNLSNPVFTHGQLYVGLSRVGNTDGLFILASQGKTQNIVYPEALS